MNPVEPFRLVIPTHIFAAMLDHAHVELPNECIGFLAGTIANGVGTVSQFLPLGNSLVSPTEFETEATSLFAAYKTMRTSHTDVLAIYHSHPTSVPIPSVKDLTNNTYGVNVVWLIVSLQNEPPEVRGWWLAKDFRPATWDVVCSSGFAAMIN